MQLGVVIDMTRGRKRKAGQRFPGGRLMPAIDRGTPEQQAMRAALLRGADGAVTADEQLAAYPLGVLLAHRIVSQALCDAGQEYARLQAAAVGRVGYDGRPGAMSGQLPDEVAAKLATDFRLAADALLRHAGRRAKDAVDNAAVFGRWPCWLLSEIGDRRRRASDAAERMALLSGLEALARHFGYARAA